MTTHTPGPWTVDDYGDSPAIRTNGGVTIAPKVWGGFADARLIAAAPELLAACEATVAAYESHQLYDKCPLAQLKAAIARATGGAVGYLIDHSNQGWMRLVASEAELSRLRAENAELRQDREILVDLFRSNSRNYSLYKPDAGRRHVEEYLAHIKARAVLAKQNAPEV